MFEIVLVGLLTLYSVKAEKYKDNTREESGKKERLCSTLTPN